MQIRTKMCFELFSFWEKNIGGNEIHHHVLSYCDSLIKKLFHFHWPCKKFQSGYLSIFWPEMNRKLSKSLKKRIFDHPLPCQVAKTASASLAKKFKSYFFWSVLTSNGCRIKNNTLRNHMGRSQWSAGCLEPKNFKNFIVDFWAFSGQKWIQNWVKLPKTAFWTTLDPIMWFKHLPPIQPKKFQSGFLGIFWSEMNRKLSKTPQNRILDHPWPYNVAQTPSTLSAKKISKWFFGHFLVRN